MPSFLFFGVWNRDGRCCLQEARRSGIKCRREIFLPLVKQGLGEIFFAPTRFLLFALLLLLCTRAFAKFAQTSSPPLPPFVLPAPMKNSPCSAVVILPSSSPSHQPRQEDVFDAGHKKRRKRRKEGLRQNPFPLPLPLSAISGLTYGLCLPCGFPKWKCLLDLGKRRRALLAVGI